MERYSDEAIRIIDELHTERLDYQSEYIPLIDAAQRLDDYESTGMEPENIGALQEELNQYKKLGDLHRLRQLVQADREGRCVVLPCKAGDTFYRGDEKYKADHWNVVLTAIFWAGERKNITLLYPEEVGKVLEEMEDK